MALIKLLVAPIRRVVNFPLFQLVAAIAVILFLQAADSSSVFGRLFSALDYLVDLSVSLYAATFQVRSFTKSWLTTGFMIAYVYIAGLLIVFLAKAAIMATVEFWLSRPLLLGRDCSGGFCSETDVIRPVLAIHASSPPRSRPGG